MFVRECILMSLPSKRTIISTAPGVHLSRFSVCSIVDTTTCYATDLLVPVFDP